MWWEMLVEENQAAKEARCDTAESRLRGGTITRAFPSPHTSFDSGTIERLAHHLPDAGNYRVGPHPRCSFK